MKIRIHKLKIVTKKSVEVVDFATDVIFINGPVSSGKSTTARLIDYCLGSSLERTPALRSEFVAAQLSATLGQFEVEFDRSSDEGSSVRATWDNGQGNKGVLSVPIDADSKPIIGENVFNLSDLIFHFCGVQPIKVRKNKSDPDSQLVRLGFRDLMWYCFLQQNELDSSFFQMEHPFKANKSRDVMRFVTGLYSERMNVLETKVAELIQTQRAKREAGAQIRQFMGQFHLANEDEFDKERASVKRELDDAILAQKNLQQGHKASTHALEPIREQLRKLTKELDGTTVALEDLQARIQEQASLKSELISTKVKASRADQAISVLRNVEFVSCPCCGVPVASTRFDEQSVCNLCGQSPQKEKELTAVDPELNSDLDARIDDLGESVDRHKRELARSLKRRESLLERQTELDLRLGQEVERYDSAYTSNARAVDSKVAQLEERIRSIEKLAQMPAAISALEKEAASLQADIDRVKIEMADEQKRLIGADNNLEAIATAFRQIMIDVGFPGVYGEDKVHLDPRNWFPYVRHGEQEWSFADAGSGGKKTLFNVCYALAVHRVALERDLPLPTLLIIDSPTKNITRDEDPELVEALYQRIYKLAEDFCGKLQVLLIDSHLVEPNEPNFKFSKRRMPPPLISYYVGP